MQRVRGQDAIFLYMETPTNHFHMAIAAVLDPTTAPGGVADGRELYLNMCNLLTDRLHLFPAFRQRLVEVPFQLGHPVLVEDPDFDLDFHVRRAALPAPGGRRELQDLVSEITSRPIDRNHPLWEMYVVEGVEDGRWALVVKAHHVIVDGVGGNEVLVNLLDLSPEPRTVEAPAEPWQPDDLPSELRLAAEATLTNLASPVRVARGVARTAGTLGGVLRQRRGAGDERPLAVLGPRTVLNGTRSSPHRRVGFGTVDLADVKQVKRAFGVKVNDVVLAMCGRGLRRFLAELGDEPDKPLVAAVPISIRAAPGEGGGNRVAGMTVPLADDVVDAGEQLERIHAVTGPAKDHLGAITADLMTDWTQFTTPTLAAQAFRFYSSLNLSRRHRPVANVTISNLPGPDFPLFIAGSQMQSLYPIGPVIHGQAVNITVASYHGRMFLGVIADRAVVADASPLVAHLEKAMGELVEAATLCETQ